nr:MAG TPA: DNA binding protein [Caudoviricetes sp.]
MTKMTKQQIIEQISERTGLRRSEAKKAVESMMDILSQTFISGENVYLRGFGSFTVRQVKEKKARIVATGEECIVPAHKAVKFNASIELKNALK